jgi:hypothetical protein
MKPNNIKKEHPEKKELPDLDSVIKIIKKKELQTKILKKILPKNVTTDNKPV